MIKAEDFLRPLILMGYTFFTGVPCSFLKPVINYVIQSDDLDYIIASSEGEAVGIAAGAYLTGEKTVVMCQNSGLGNMINPLTSLNYPFKIPFLLIITLRGEPGINDEPQHELMGRITGKLLSTIGIQWKFFPDQAHKVVAELNEAKQLMEELSLPFAFIMRKGAVDTYPLTVKPKQSRLNENAEIFGKFACNKDKRMSRIDAIKVISEGISSDDAVVATTGKIGRELFSTGDKENQIYIVGSMGCASGIGFGVQITRSQRTVIVLDGDGAALMKMGAFATIGYYMPAKFIHIILDNGAYESTGGQATTSNGTDFSSVAAGCGYRKCWRVDNYKLLKQAILEAKKSRGPILIHVKVAIREVLNLPRPDLRPVEVKRRFMKFLADTGQLADISHFA